MNPDRNTLRAILFDLDGTLLDSGRRDILVMNRLFRDDLSLAMGEGEVSKYLGIPSREVLEQLAPDQVEELLAVWLDYQDEMLSETCLFPGVLEVLHSMAQASIDLGVVTGQNRLELEATRRHIAIDGLIDVWVCADDAAYTKPHPAPVHLALDVLGCRPDQAIMIGDTRFDMEAGRQAGTRIGVASWGVNDLVPLLNFQPDFIFENPQQMQNLLFETQKGEGGTA